MMSPDAKEAIRAKLCPLTGKPLEDGMGHRHPAHQVGMEIDAWERDLAALKGKQADERAAAEAAAQAAREAPAKLAIAERDLEAAQRRIAELEAEVASLKGVGDAEAV